MSVATSSGLSSTISNGCMGTLSDSDFTTLTTKRSKGSPSRPHCGTNSSSKVCLKLNRGHTEGAFVTVVVVTVSASAVAVLVKRIHL
jgi:hypothetical protein